MKRISIHGWRKPAVLLAGLAFAANWATGQVRSVQDRAEVTRMIENKKTVCVGRYLVDVPASAAVTSSHQMIDGFEIDQVRENEASFRDRVAMRETALMAQRTDRNVDDKGALMEARDIRVPGMVGRTLIYGKDHTYGIEQGHRVEVEWVSVEAYVHKAGRNFVLSMRYGSEAKADVAEALLARLQIRDENEVPSASGFCILGGLFVEPLPPHQTEHIVVHLGLPGHADIGMTVASLPGGGRKSSLLSRAAINDEEASLDELLRVTALRTGKRTINGMDGEEVLERAREVNFVTTFGFMWETQGRIDDVLRPFISLELQGGMNPAQGGKQVESSLRQDALLALWDSISSSIRLRGRGFVPLMDDSQPTGERELTFNRLNRRELPGRGSGDVDRTQTGDSHPFSIRRFVAKLM